MNWGRPRTNQARGQRGTRTQDRMIASPTRWPLRHTASYCTVVAVDVVVAVMNGLFLTADFLMQMWLELGNLRSWRCSHSDADKDNRSSPASKYPKAEQLGREDSLYPRTPCSRKSLKILRWTDYCWWDKRNWTTLLLLLCFFNLWVREFRFRLR